MCQTPRADLHRSRPTITCEDEEQFLEKLGDILRKPRLRKILSVLISHSEAELSGTQSSTATNA